MSVLLAALLAMAPSLSLECETGTLGGNAVIAKSRSGYSGSGYADGFKAASDYLDLLVDIPTSGVYTFRLRYQTLGGSKGIDVGLDGKTISSPMLPDAATWDSVEIATVLLTAGPHTLRLGGGWNWYLLDRVDLATATATPPPTPSEAPVDPKADQAALKLHAFLKSQYGKKVLTGQTDSSEAAWLYQTTGKLPAIIAFDMIDHTPSRHRIGGGNPQEPAEKALRWGKSGGIVAYQWHWVSPSGVSTGNDPETGNPAWWGGFYTRNTTFDLGKALADPNGSDFRHLMEDIDSISMQLAKLRDAGIPVLWRPLHEASGGWFWWGEPVVGAENLKALWRLVFERMTITNGLHNLLWVWTAAAEPSAVDLYPGDDMVDVIGLDVYADSGSNLATEWNSLAKLSKTGKLLTVSECGHGGSGGPGVLPRPGLVDEYGTWWSWEVTWNGSHVRNWPSSRLRDIYTSDLMITLDELPDWSKPSTAASPGLFEAPGFEIVSGPQGFRWSTAKPIARKSIISIRDTRGAALWNSSILAGIDHGSLPSTGPGLRIVEIEGVGSRSLPPIP
ncbi:MAG: hypothetical protein H6686_12995 [Fibrobacteria bacterium]|nr:hypothetical protein [Fibrobacteria bacterium]